MLGHSLRSAVAGLAIAMSVPSQIVEPPSSGCPRRRLSATLPAARVGQPISWSWACTALPTATGFTTIGPAVPLRLELGAPIACTRGCILLYTRPLPRAEWRARSHH